MGDPADEAIGQPRHQPVASEQHGGSRAPRLIQEMPERHPAAEGEARDRVVVQTEPVDEFPHMPHESLLRERPLRAGAAPETGMVGREDVVSGCGEGCSDRAPGELGTVGAASVQEQHRHCGFALGSPFQGRDRGMGEGDARASGIHDALSL